MQKSISPKQSQCSNNNRNYHAMSWRSWKRYLFPLAIRYCFDNTKAINALDGLVAEVLTARGYTGLIFIQNTFGIEARFYIDRIRVRESATLEVIYVGVLEKFSMAHHRLWSRLSRTSGSS